MDKLEMDESIKTIKGIKRKQSIKEDSSEELEDISNIIFDSYYGDKFVDEMDVVTRKDIDYYYTLIKTVDDAEMFNYHSDYWGDADRYQEQNVDLINSLSPYVGKEVQIDYDDGLIKGKLLGIAVDRQYNDITHTKVILDSIEEILEEKSKNNYKLKEDLEREFTIFFDREGFEYGSYGAVRVKATNEDEAEEKFYANNKDDKIHITSIRPTENEDIRKGIRLMEEYKNPLKIDDVEDKAREAVDPSYAQALKDRKKFNKITDKKVSADLDNVLNKQFTLDNVKKYTLDESLFENWDEIDDSKERELSADDYLEDVRRGRGWVEIDKIQMDLEYDGYHCNVQDVLNKAAEKGWKFDYRRPEGLIIYVMKANFNEDKDIKKFLEK